MQRKQILRLLAAMMGAVVLAPALTACGGGGDEPLPAATTGLSAEEIAALKFMREEEKLAHDVYVALFDLWATPVFSNIAQSETTHTEAILNLLIRYGVDDPAIGKAVGEFDDPVLQTFYDTLLSMGQVSLIEALKVGALIEETDVRDINEKKALTDEADILQVYDSLLCGSRNHLRAFNGQLVSRGVTYVPQVITQIEWDAIANASGETCGG
jgi:hypothetical protein